MKKLITLAAIAMVMVATLQTAFSQPVDPTYWHYKQKKSNWLFEHDTVRINCLRIDNKLAIDSLGRMWWYNNSAATLGNLLVGNGTYYNQLAIGSTGQVLTVSGGTATWQPGGAAAIIGDPFGVWIGDSEDGHIIQVTDEFAFDYIDEHRLELFDNYYYCENTAGDFAMGKYMPGSWQVQDNNLDLFTGSPTEWVFDFPSTGGGSFSWRANNATTADIYLISPIDVPAAGDIWTVDADGHTIVFKTLAELGGASFNLSYDATNHEVDISGGGTSAVVPLAVDDGATEGLASFAAADFTATAGNVVIDYANGQAATSGQDGFLQSSDWTTFNNKVGLVQAPTELSGQTSSIGASTVYTTPASDGYYRVTVTATVTTAAGSTMDLGIQLRFTEATDNVVKTFPNGNVNGYNRTTTNTTAATVSVSAVCHVKASTNIQYITSWSPSGGSPAYNVHVTVEKLY